VNYRPNAIVLKQFAQNKKLCIFHYLATYLQRTAILRHDHTQLILAYKKPHHPVSQNTITRWIKQALQSAGVDVSTFTAGSTRAAATSKAKQQGAPIQQIMEMGGWARASMFTRFYDRPILSQTVAERVLMATSTE
jgi:site-specific recombinase XerD